jgi:hypothetical protein
MQPTPLARRITFGLIVFVLVGLGAYLVRPGARGTGGPTTGPGKQARSAPATASTVPSASTGPSAGAEPGQAGAADIYQWLPFTQSGLASAATVARRFGDAYGTFSYAESPEAYAATLQPLGSAQLAGQIQAAYAAPGVGQARTQAKEVSAGTAVIESIRSFGPTSLTFVVQVTEQLTTTNGRSQQATVYAMTLTGTGSTWQVTDVELASAGNT